MSDLSRPVGEAAVAAAGLDATGRPGSPATGPEYRMEPQRTVSELARALARLHTIVPVSGPGEVRQLDRLDPASIVAECRRHRASGALVEGRLGEAYRHMTVDRLVEILDDGVDRVEPPSELVITHGRPTLDRFRCDGGTAVGLVDWSRLALADPYRDLAVAARSIAVDFDPSLLPVLFDGYGLFDGHRAASVDVVRLDWYSLAAELSP